MVRRTPTQSFRRGEQGGQAGLRLGRGVSCFRRGDDTKKVQLERALQALDPIVRPIASSEQIPTPAPIAAEMLWMAHAKTDIAGRSVADLGSGNGILAIGAKLLGASRAVGVESDPQAVAVARRNGERARVDVEWRHGHVTSFRDQVDTVVMNPPFGAQTRHADRPFLDTAMAVGRVVYTFLNANAEGFVRQRIEDAGGRIDQRHEYAFPIPHLFSFHRETAREVPVLLYRVEAAKG
ncbi:MAG: methyltransferase [Methanobacteriota archaeon]|nr:MAG: methyltransferase [Euryarchaeota archaeon]